LSSKVRFGMLKSRCFVGISVGISKIPANGYQQKGGQAMPKRITPLTPSQINHAEPKEKPFKLYDGYGLYILVTPTGSKLWRFNYRFEGAQKSLSFGSYPDVSMDEARTMRNDAQQMLKEGIDPSVVRKELLAEEKTERNTSYRQASVRVDMDGNIEIWKGRISVRLTSDEAHFIKNQLCKLV
jgi:hypothetical protein